MRKAQEQKEKLQVMGQAAKAYQASRAPHQDAIMNAMATALGAWAPAQAAMGQMYGPGAQTDTTPFMMNPLTQSSIEIGAPGSKPKSRRSQAKSRRQARAAGTRY